ncbi:porin [Candidatus Electronema sp. PJ]|uniref:porin n=1 Tax=Candidatus Electronema sp. PJ TaxID=3401572 RepID=UPI003AA83BC3
MKKQLPSASSISLVAGAMLFAAATGASALEIKSGNDKVDLQLKGHVNRAVMYADDGNESNVFHVDNTNSETRVGLYGKLAATEYLTIGSNFELQWQANPSDKVSMEEESISGDFKERLAEVYFDCKKGGKLWLGRGKMTSDDSSEVDLSGTDLAGNSGVTDVGGGFKFYNAAAAPAPEDSEESTGFTVKDVFNSMDGTRYNRVRYDTPKFAGFSLGAAAGEQDLVDAILRYSGEFAETKLEGALSWSNPGDNGDYSQINGSASVLFNSGLNLTAAGGTRDMNNMPVGGDEPIFMYGKIGYICDKMFAIGSTAVSVDYGIFENAKKQNIGQEGTATGVQFVQNLSDWSTELFAAYRGYALEDTTGADYEDITIVMGGARFKF